MKRGHCGLCAIEKRGLKTLSAERIRQELLKLLAAPRAVETLKVMAEHRILATVLPHTEEWRVLKRLPPDALLRLFVLAKEPDSLKERLRLSNAEAERLQRMSSAPAPVARLADAERRRMLYHLGAGAWRDAVHLSKAASTTNNG